MVPPCVVRFPLARYEDTGPHRPHLRLGQRRLAEPPGRPSRDRQTSPARIESFDCSPAAARTPRRRLRRPPRLRQTFASARPARCWAAEACEDVVSLRATAATPVRLQPAMRESLWTRPADHPSAAG